MKPEARKRFADLVLELRGDQSRNAFAKKVGVAGVTIKDWENCKVNVSYDNRKQIAQMAGYHSMDEFDAFLNGEPLPVKEQASLADEAIKLIRRLNSEDSKRVADAAWQQSFAAMAQPKKRRFSDSGMRVSQVWQPSEESLDSDPKVIPLYSSAIAAGVPSPADDHLDEQINLNEYLIRHEKGTFFVKVDGDSMIEAGIHSGDLLVVDRILEATDHKIVVAAYDGELTVKRLRFLDRQPYLMPENPSYSPLPVREETDCHIWGVVTNVIHPV
jgi:DNA polymerase V